jgi:hypothetical protein
MNREERIERGKTIADLMNVIERHVGADEAAEEKVQEIVDLLETVGKLLLPYHHVRVECVLIFP